MRTVVASVVIAASVAVVAAQTSDPEPARIQPNFSVQVWGNTVADFTGRVDQYFQLRRKLESELPPLVATDNAGDIIAAELNLARLVRQARRSAKRGEIFTRPIASAFREALAPVMQGPVLDVILDENPGAFSDDIDRRYPTTKPKATIPTAVLELLPPLPEDLRYGFLGHQLIIHDTRTNTIVDLMRCAIPCGTKLKVKDDD